jgi:TRAP-type C4-dicarboxylate transport system substrate-binding protein
VLISAVDEFLSTLLTLAATTSIASAALAEPSPAANIRMATLAPKQSPWGKVFSRWSKAVEDKTHGSVAVQWLWNGTAGPEASVVGKIRSGQITGAAITAVGLSAIHKPIAALQMPGAFKTWAELDKARESLKGDFDRAMVQAGFYVSGWGDVGIGRTFSRGFAVVRPDDLRGKTPIGTAADLIAPKVYEAIGGITAKTADVVEFLPLLNSGAVNVVTAPALAAEQLQWTSQLDHMNTGVTGFGVGAVVLSEAALSKLSAEDRSIMETTGQAANVLLTKIVRSEDDQAFERLKKKMTVHDMTEAERADWDRVWKKACLRVKAALPGDVLSKIGYC